MSADPTKNPANPKARYGDMKRRVDLVPPALELGAAVALAEGAEKYGPFNWRINHVEAMTYVAAIKRHLAAYVDGEDVDPESVKGKLHLEGIAASVAILLDSLYAGILIDNRPAKGPGPALTRLPAPKPEAKAEPAPPAEAEAPHHLAALFKPQVFIDAWLAGGCAFCSGPRDREREYYVCKKCHAIPNWRKVVEVCDSAAERRARERTAR